MSEVTFAKSYLATLDKRPIKLPADHVSDPRKYSNQSPYILPKQSHPFPRRGLTSNKAQADRKKIDAILKPMRGGEAITISDLTVDSTIHDIKTQYALKSGLPQDRVKLLLNKKPAGDLKTLKDLGVKEDSVEFSVMVIGGAVTGSASPVVMPSPTMEKNASIAGGQASDKMEIDESTAAPASEKAQVLAEKTPANLSVGAELILNSEEFWTDLRAYLAQRLRDEKEADRLAGLFRETCKG